MAPISNASRLAEFGSGIGTDGAVIQVDNINKRVGIGTTNPQGMLQVGQGVTVYGSTGIVSATSYYGDGSNLDGLVSAAVTQYIAADSITSSGIVTITNTTDATSTSTGALIISGGVGIAKSLHVGQNITIGGTLTYEDVTNVDSIGVVTARSGVNVSGGQFLVGSGVTIGNAGVATFSGTSDVHLLDNVRLNVGDSSDLAIYHASGWNYIQGVSNSLAIQAKSGENSITAAADGNVALYYDGSAKFETTNNGSYTTGIATATGSLVAGVNADTGVDLRFRANRSSANQTIGNINGYWNDTVVGQIRFMAGEDTTNKDDCHLTFYTASAGTVAERLRIASNGRIGIATEVPEALVDIEGGEVYYHSGTGNAFGVKLSYSNGNSTGIIDSYGNHDLELRTNDVARFVLDTSGNLQTKTTTQNSYVGLTTTSNAINLTFGGTSGTSPRLYLKGVGNGQSDAGDTFLATGSGGEQIFRSHTFTKFEVNADSTPAEALRIDSSGRIIIGEDSAITTSSNRLLQVVGDTNGGGVIVLGRNDTTLTNESLGGIEFYGNDPGSAFTRAAAIMCEAAAEWTSNDYPTKLIFRTTPDGSSTNTTALTLDSSQNATFAGSVSDSKGDVRKIIYQNKTSGYTLVASDAGKAIHISTGGVTINDNIFSAGDAVTIINNSGSDQTITQGSGVTLYDTGDDGSTGNKTLKGRGMATVWFSSDSVGYISGNF